MRFGVRECVNVVFKAKSNIRIGNTVFKPGQPVLYMDSAKMGTLEGAATTVYATGGRGNTRLIGWEGEKTLTFTVEDALLSPVGLAILSGAGLIKKQDQDVHVHMTSVGYADSTTGEIDLTDALTAAEKVCPTAPLFIMETEADGSLTGVMFEGAVVDASGKKITVEDAKGKNVMVDFYVTKPSADVSEIQIDAEHFAGYYYVEADTLFRRQDNGVDMPANLTIPNVKIQSNFTFSMGSTGDPSTFTFTMDSYPGYTYFDRKTKVLCVIQVIEDAEASQVTWDTVMPHNKDGVDKYDVVEDSSTPKARTVSTVSLYN